MATKNIIIRKREEESLKGMYHYCEIIGTKWFNRCKLPWGKRLAKGDVFNVYLIRYEEDGKGEIKRWIDEVKHGCEYDGVSLETSLQQCDKELEEYYTTGNGRYAPCKPLGLFLFERDHFTENEAGAVSKADAMTLAESTTKAERKVWHYDLDCGTFDADYGRGAIDLSKYWVRTM